MDDRDWRNHQQQLQEEDLRILDSDSMFCYGGNDIGLLSGNVCNLFQKSDQPSYESSRWSLPQEESRRSEPAGEMVGKAGVDGSSCGVLVHMMNPQNELILEKMTPAGGSSSNLGSLESIDCLLSTSSGQTTENTSVEDDGISMIFSGCKNGRENFTGNSFDSAVKSVPSVALLSSGNAKGGTTDTQVLHMLSEDHRDMITGKLEPRRSLWNFTRKFDSSSSKSAVLLSTNTNARGGGTDLGTVSGTPAGECAKKTVQSGSSAAECEINAAKRRRLEKNQTPGPTNSRSGKRPISSSNISFQKGSSSASSADEPDSEAIAQMKEMIYRAAAFRPVNLGEENLEKPKRRNVKISKDPQTVAARQRRERISEKIRVLQRLVPGGSKLDTASMLDEAANYLKFLRSQIKALEASGHIKNDHHNLNTINFPANLAFSPFANFLPPASAPPLRPQFSIENPTVIHHQFEI